MGRVYPRPVFNMGKKKTEQVVEKTDEPVTPEAPVVEPVEQAPVVEKETSLLIHVDDITNLRFTDGSGIIYYLDVKMQRGEYILKPWHNPNA